MLIIAKKMKELSFGKLMEVYAEGNLENGRECWPLEPESRQIALAEEEFFNYLQQVFFKTDSASYLIWEDGGCYISALRFEPYRDGLLLEALETRAEKRRSGYARKLLEAALEFAGELSVYSHIHKQNMASIRTHEKCGFVKIEDYAVYIDGSVNARCCTYCRKI